MVGWSLPLGKVFGVGLRLHSFFVFLLLLCVVWSSYMERPVARGVMLWLLVLLAVAVRETARALVAAWFGIEIRSILLLPTGGLLSYGSVESTRRAGEPEAQRWMAAAGPVANVLCGLTLGALALAIAPGVQIVELPWVSPIHLLRALVWVNLLLGVLNLLPAWPLDGGRVMQGQVMRAGSAAGAGAGMKMLARLGPATAIGLVLVGVLARNWWIMVAGFTVLMGAQAERQGVTIETGADSVLVGDVMLTEYSVLSASATLEDALMQARQTLQDVFPVVRGNNVVGAVARPEIVQALEASGNGYVQGIMAKSFQTAVPEEPLVTALARASGPSGAETAASTQLVPVMQGDRIVGILTPQNLQRSMRLLVRKAIRADQMREDA